MRSGAKGGGQNEPNWTALRPPPTLTNNPGAVKAHIRAFCDSSPTGLVDAKHQGSHQVDHIRVVTKCPELYLSIQLLKPLCT